MSDGNLWGPWIDHDGKGCPCFGMAARIQRRDGDEKQGVLRDRRVVDGHPLNAWVWDASRPEHLRMREIIRYRIRKPRALLDMIERARELDDAPTGPVRTPAKEVVG